MKSIFLQKSNPLKFFLAFKHFQSFYFLLIFVLEYQLNTIKTSLRDNTIILLKIKIPCDKYFYVVKFCVVK